MAGFSVVRRCVVVAAGLISATVSAAGVTHAASAEPNAATPLVVTVRTSGVQSIIRYVSTHPTEYSGIYLDRATNEFVVAVPNGRDMTSGLEQAVTGQGAAGASTHTVGVTVVHEQRSLRQLRQIEAGVGRHEGLFGSLAGSRVIQWGLNEQNNTVVVGVTRLDGALVAAARQTYGDGVQVTQAQPSYVASRATPLAGMRKVATPARVGREMPQAAQTSPRLLDSQPYWAGDRIGASVQINGNNYIIQCTTGWMSGVRQGQQTGTSYAFTAGHCMPQNTPTYQGYCTIVNNQCQFSYTGEMGVVNTVQFGNGRPDWESVNPAGISSLGQTMYLGPVDPTGSVGEYDLVSSALNEPICANGSFTGESCNGTVNATEGCVELTDPTAGTTTNVCNQDFASSPGPRLVQEGDSGGPVIGYDGGTDQTGIDVGVISGGNVGNNGPGTELNFTDGGDICNISGEC